MDRHKLYGMLCEILKRGKQEDLIKFIRMNFSLLFESADVLLKTSSFFEKFESEREINDPVYKILKARIYSLQHRPELIEKEFRNLNLKDIPEDFLDYYYFIVAHVHFNKKNFNLALKVIEMGLEIAESRKKRHLNVLMDYKLKNFKGIISFTNMNYEKALCSFEEALESAKRAEISEVGVRGIMENIAKTHMIIGDFDKALEFFDNILENIKGGFYHRILRKVAVCYLNMGDIERAGDFMQKAFRAADFEKAAEHYYIFLYLTYSDICMAEKDVKGAKKAIEDALKIGENFSFLNVYFSLRLSELKFLLFLREVKKAEKLIELMENMDIFPYYESEFLFYKAIFHYYKDELEKSEVYFKEVLHNIPYDIFLRNVVEFGYNVFKNKCGTLEENKKGFILPLILRCKKTKFYDIEFSDILGGFARIL